MTSGHGGPKQPWSATCGKRRPHKEGQQQHPRRHHTTPQTHRQLERGTPPEKHNLDGSRSNLPDAHTPRRTTGAINSSSREDAVAVKPSTRTHSRRGGHTASAIAVAVKPSTSTHSRGSGYTASASTDAAATDTPATWSSWTVGHRGGRYAHTYDPDTDPWHTVAEEAASTNTSDTASSTKRESPAPQQPAAATGQPDAPEVHTTPATAQEIHASLLAGVLTRKTDAGIVARFENT